MTKDKKLRSANNKRYYAAHREEIKTKRREYYAAHHEECLLRNKINAYKKFLCGLGKDGAAGV